MMNNFDQYQSPYSWRYGTEAMRNLWGETNKRLLWRRIWVALAKAQNTYGLLTARQVDDLVAHQDAVDIPRALEIETEIQHDLMAELKTFAEQCPVGGGALHLGATSMDIEDNADAIRLKQSLELILKDLQNLLHLWTEKIEQWADFPILAFTHIQPAEPSTLGYRFAIYAQDLLMDWDQLIYVKNDIKGKGFKGAVGSSAAYVELVGKENYRAFEDILSKDLEIPFFIATNQTYPRKQEYQILSALAGLGASLHKFAFDIRLLQSPMFGEISEPFGRNQVGSSAMPFKRNPIQSEKIDSLSRLLAQYPRVAWDNAANTLLERTLDDSANRRTILPEAFLIADELLRVSTRIVSGLQIDQQTITRNLETYSPFSATEKLLIALGKVGADRQEFHSRLRDHSMNAWNVIRTGQPNPLIEIIAQDQAFLAYFSADELRSLLKNEAHLGNSSEKARELAGLIKLTIAEK